MSSTGFITFNDLAGVSTAAVIPLSHDPDVLVTSIAPDPRDIIWLVLYYVCSSMST